MLLTCAQLLAGCLIGWTDDEARAAPPNIIVIVSDDQGFADLGCHGVVDDVRTPHLDRLAAEGVQCTAAYVTAPQCSPSRAALVTGRYSQRFGIEEIADLPLPLEELTVAERLRDAGYVTGMVGKWHLEPLGTSVAFAEQTFPQLGRKPGGRVEMPFVIARPFLPHGQGFVDFYVGELDRYYVNFGPGAEDVPPQGRWVAREGFRVDVQTEAALAFLEAHADKRFFLYLSYFAPHVPLGAPRRYLGRFTDPMPERRRHGLASIAAMDDGVGRLLERLAAMGIDDETLIVFLSDNGAPLAGRVDREPLEGVGWNGSVNDPWVGEKGMLSEGGLRVPMLWRWPAGLPTGTVYERPVSALDVAATAVALAGLPPDETLDGVDLIPHFTGERTNDPHQALAWRFWNQAAIREGRWKLIHAGADRRLLFDLESDAHETRDLAAEHPEIVERLLARLELWAAELDPPGLPEGPLNPTERRWFDDCFPADD